MEILSTGNFLWSSERHRHAFIGYELPKRVAEAMKQQLHELFRDFGVERYAFVSVGHADGKSDN